MTRARTSMAVRREPNEVTAMCGSVRKIAMGVRDRISHQMPKPQLEDEAEGIHKRGSARRGTNHRHKRMRKRRDQRMAQARKRRRRRKKQRNRSMGTQQGARRDAIRGAKEGPARTPCPF